MMFDMPSSNVVWGAYLKNKRFTRHTIPNNYPDCYTVADFVKDNPNGKYIVATISHIIAVVNRNYYDTWDSGSEILIFYWRKENEIRVWDIISIFSNNSSSRLFRFSTILHISRI